MEPLHLSPKAYAMIPDELKHVAVEVSEPSQPDNDTLADMAAVELLHTLETPIGGVPGVKITNYVNARRLVKAAFLAVYEGATGFKKQEDDMGQEDSIEPINVSSPLHPHEPGIPPALDSEGRCLVCCILCERDDARQDARENKEAYFGACKLVAEMHAAAMGEVCGPKRGVVEDIADLRTERDQCKALVPRLPEVHQAYRDEQDIGRCNYDSGVTVGMLRGTVATGPVPPSPGFDGEIPNRRSFDDELVCLLNKYSKENGSNTPDFILAEHLKCCLDVWNDSVKAREEWYGREFKAGSIGGGS